MLLNDESNRISFFFYMKIKEKETFTLAVIAVVFFFAGFSVCIVVSSRMIFEKSRKSV